jgi:hypothetical protein
MRDNADHQHGHDHAFGVGAAHEAAHGAEPVAAETASGGLHEGLSDHLGGAEAHAGAVSGVLLPDHSVDHHAPVDDHAHLGDGGGGHFGLGIEHDHADGLSGLHDSIHESGLGIHGDEHHGLGDALHIGHDHHADPHDHGHHDVGDAFHL